MKPPNGADDFAAHETRLPRSYARCSLNKSDLVALMLLRRERARRRASTASFA